MPQVLDAPEVIQNIGHEPMYQVVLFNDPVNTFEHVISMLISIFGHNQDLAIKIATEAHQEGRAIAEVEGKEQAIAHKEQLVSAGLTAEAEPIST